MIIVLCKHIVKIVSDSDGNASENKHHKLTENVLAESRASKNDKEKENLQEKDKSQQYTSTIR